MKRILLMMLVFAAPAAHATTRIKALRTYPVSHSDIGPTGHSGKTLAVLEKELAAALAPLKSKKAAELRGLAGLLSHGTVHSVDGPRVVNVKSLLRARRAASRKSY